MVYDMVLVVAEGDVSGGEVGAVTLVSGEATGSSAVGIGAVAMDIGMDMDIGIGFGFGGPSLDMSGNVTTTVVQSWFGGDEGDPTTVDMSGVGTGAPPHPLCLFLLCLVTCCICIIIIASPVWCMNMNNRLFD
ncbi:hypothetical protein SAMD00019534_013250 [Acytostelium subglobosum LB1]|uniref:hypothetical protein n=1 Tax=Acytostelium subglobosum LB1 TaxID=1410327 RepID=UPI000644F090|nr:hypothetical protein SAMD00019534_013250 [Acytostelium subglobosum LB1]GAM18150.1 hypothetical protein SAMD00019534_013250 [Acytostelium subglobosum LB1]|eukprot:XP_012758746.1 hypothetical protein SAMD00019534_013250 [Acytostelium subglobosum LB1]